MAPALVVSIISLLISILGFVLGISWALWKISFKVNVMWRVFIDPSLDPSTPRRRKADRRLMSLIEDRGQVTKKAHD